MNFFKKSITILGLALAMTACSGGGLGKQDLSVTREKTYELGDDVVLDPAEFILSDLNDDELKEVKIDSELINSDLYEYSGWTRKVTDKGKKILSKGTYTVKFIYDDKEYPVSLIIKDTTAPTFVSPTRTIFIQEGEEMPDINTFYKADDLDEVTLSMEGEVDTSEAGRYPVTIIATDASGNSTSLDVTVRVLGENEGIGADELDSIDLEKPSTGSDDTNESSGDDQITNPDQTQDPGVIPDQPQQPACSVDYPDQSAVFSTLDEVMAAGREWIAQDPEHNYFQYSYAKDSCGNNAFIIHYGTGEMSN